MKAILSILFFYLLGSVVSWLIGGFIPASVLGMIFLFIALTRKWVNADKMKPTCDFLLSNLLLFFVPVAVGVIGSYMLFKEYIWAILVSSLISTVVVITVVGGVAQLLIKMRSK